MADTYSDQLRIRLQANGANSATWGTISNTNFELFESAISGLASLATTGGTYTLSTTNGADDEARHAILKITGVLVSNSTVVVPSKTKNYIVWNATTGDYTVTIKTAAGTGVFVPRDGAASVFCDGTNVYSAERSATDSTFTIYDQADPTKAMAFQVSGVTTATTRTLTVPDASGTIMLTSAIGSTVQAYDADLTTWAGVTPGTGVATALAVNIGTAGAPVINGGALGTPASGTLTNATGLPAAGVIGSALTLAGGNMTGGINSARGNITQHATTMGFFAVTSPDILDGTGSAVTITACVNAPQAGATRKFYPIVATVLTHGATFDIAGNVNLTAAAGDCWIIEAKTASTYRVTAVKEDGTAVVAGAAFDPASPGAIGGTTPAAITATTLKHTGAMDSQAVRYAGDATYHREAEITKTFNPGASAAIDVATCTLTDNYSVAIVTVEAMGMTGTGNELTCIAKRTVKMVGDSPTFTTVGTDLLSNCSVAFSYVATHGFKATITNGIAQQCYGGMKMSVIGGGGDNVDGGITSLT